MREQFPLPKRLNSPMTSILKRACLWVSAALAVTLLAGMLLQRTLSRAVLRDNPAPGELIDVEGRAVHLVCRGRGGPVVILEAGLPGSSLTWSSVTPGIAEFARVCAYDRAGYGWSEPGPRPRTSGSIARELRLLLQNASIEPPYVLVGHSFGGLVAQTYASRFPDEVAGMVLVDASHPDLVHQTVEIERMGVLSLFVRGLAVTGVGRFIVPVPSGSPESRDPSVRKLERDLQFTTRSLRATSAELAALRDSLSAARTERPRLGVKPLIVLTEGRMRAKPWLDMQAKLAELSGESRWRIVNNAGHFIHHDRPEVVVGATRSVVESVRSAPG